MIAEQLGKLTHKGIDVLELSVNRGKTYICHLIDIFEFFHNKIADIFGLDFAIQRVEQLLLDI